MKNCTVDPLAYCCTIAKYLKAKTNLKYFLKFSTLVFLLFSIKASASFFPAATNIKNAESLTKNYRAFLKHSTTFSSNKHVSFSNAAYAPAGITESIRTNLYLLNADSSTILADGDYAEYNNLYHDSVTLEDAPKFTNILENIGLLRYGQTLSIERRPIITTNDTLFLKLWKTTRRSYQIEFVANMLTNVGLQSFFIDSYLNTSTPIGIEGTTKINFSINEDAASQDMYRFKIIFKPRAAIYVAPHPHLTFTSVTAYPHLLAVAIDWNVQNSSSAARYQVERSTDGKNFSIVNAITAATSFTDSYSWVDGNPVAGNNYYRIKAIEFDGSEKYTEAIKVMAAPIRLPWSIYPNPVSGNVINVRYFDQAAGICQVKIMTITGLVVYTGKLSVANKSSTMQIHLPALSKGIYQMEIQNADNLTQVQKVIIE